MRFRMPWFKRNDTKLTQRLQRISVPQLRAERKAEQLAAVEAAERIVRMTKAT